MSDYYIFKIKNINLEERVKRFPPNFKFNFDFGYLIIHFILEQMAHSIEDGENPNVYESFRQLSSIILQKLNRDYCNHIRYLGENFPSVGNIIERKNYSVGQSYSYRLRPYYHNHQLEPHLLSDKGLIKKLKVKNSSSISPSVENNYRFLIDYFNSKRLTILLQDALNFNANELEENGKLKNYLSNAFKILKIQNGKYYLKNNLETDGRVHTNITGFPKKFRKFLRYDGEKMVEIDISASVPNFLFYFLSNLSSSTSHLDKIINKKKLYYVHYMLVKNSVSIDFIEIQNFEKEILNGTLYSSFLTLIKEFSVLDDSYHQWQFNEYFFPNQSYHHKPKSKDLKISDSKMALLSMFNAKNTTYILEELSFKNSYPSIFKFIFELKKIDHKYFSYIILQIESYFMLNIIAKGIDNKFKKKIPILTLHDCIVTTESQITNIKDFMEITFEKELGFIPVMKTKKWYHDNEF